MDSDKPKNVVALFEVRLIVGNYTLVAFEDLPLPATCDRPIFCNATNWTVTSGSATFSSDGSFSIEIFGFVKGIDGLIELAGGTGLWRFDRYLTSPLSFPPFTDCPGPRPYCVQLPPGWLYDFAFAPSPPNDFVPVAVLSDTGEVITTLFGGPTEWQKLPN